MLMPKMAHHLKSNFVRKALPLALGAVAALVAFAALAFTVPQQWEVGAVATSSPTIAVKLAPPPVAHIKTPVPLKGIYMSQCVVGTPSFRDSLVKFIDDSAANEIGRAHV